MTDNEITKALECCYDKESCIECPYRYVAEGDGKDCEDILGEDARKLINRQKAEIEGLNNLVKLSIDTQNEFSNKICEQEEEIERLTNKLEQREEIMANLGVELTIMRGAANSYKMHYEKSQAELERLEKDRYIFKDGVLELIPRTDIEEIKSEAINEFVKRLKDRVVKKYEYTDIRVFNELDNLVKEMVGE